MNIDRRNFIWTVIVLPAVSFLPKALPHVVAEYVLQWSDHRFEIQQFVDGTLAAEWMGMPMTAMIENGWTHFSAAHGECESYAVVKANSEHELDILSWWIREPATHIEGEQA